MLQIFRKIGDWSGLTAARCPVCGVLINRYHDKLCEQCEETLIPRTGGFCPSCGDIVADETAPTMLCGECRTSPPPWDSLHFHGVYAGTLRDIIIGYKFNNGLGRTRFLADLAYTTYKNSAGQIPDVMIPVPLHPKRLQWRGYNQSTEICRTLTRELNVPIILNGLTRVRHTKPQTSLGMVERQENIKDAFEADPCRVKGKAVLLVDDVYTTGATLRESAKTLKQAGAAKVIVLVLARTMG